MTIDYREGNDLDLDAVLELYRASTLGERLIEETRRRMGPRSMLVLLAAPAAREYYPHIGFTLHDSAWVLRQAPAADRS